ncbi:MAG: protein kinase [Planctomycetes bacterium]|nr:protein kinase [Planctomycetota bacterium]
MERYELRKKLGEGAQGTVYEGWDTSLNRSVAIKLLRPEWGTNEAMRHRFLREARLAAGLSHPNVIQVFDVGEARGELYIVMERVHGLSLARLLQAKTMDQKTALEILEKAARGVGAAHERGIVHRDLKPANILVTSEGEPKVGDFGMARFVDSTSAITRARTPVGTPFYMAPEQVRGSLAEMTPRTDVYAMGAVLYEIVTGRPPFVENAIPVLYKRVLLEEPVPLRKANPKASAALEAICLKALEKDPELRYASGTEFADDLKRYRDSEQVLARPPGWARRAARWIRTHQALGPVAAVVLLAGLFMAVGWLIAKTGEPTKREARMRAVGPKHDAVKEGVTVPRSRSSREWRLLRRRLNVTRPGQDESAILAGGPVEVRTARRNARLSPWTPATPAEVREVLIRSSFTEKCLKFIVDRLGQAEEIRLSLNDGRLASLVARSEERWEEWSAVSSAEAPEYELELGPGIGSVTLAPDGYVEFRDLVDSAWLRMPRPLVIDAEGTRTAETILVNGVEPDPPHLVSIAIDEARTLEIRVRFDAKKEHLLPALVGVGWTGTSHMAVSREWHGLTRLEDGRVLVGCGQNEEDEALSACEVFDPVTETWSSAASLPASEGRLLPVLTCLKNGQVLLTGGYVSSLRSVLSTAFVWDPGGDWTPTTNPMSSGRVRHESILLEDGRVLVAGGATMVPPGYLEDPRGGTPTSDLYLPVTNSFVPAAAMNESRRSFGAVRMDDGRVLVAGGFKQDLGARNTCEIYTPDAEGGRWQSAPPLRGPRGYFSLIRLPDGGVLRSGGNDGGVSVADCEVFSGGRWMPTGSMPEGRNALATEIDTVRGIVLQAGGNIWGPSDKTHRYEGGRWTGPRDGEPLLNEKRDRTVAMRIEEGKLLIVGGRPDDTFERFSATAEIYDDGGEVNQRPSAPSGLQQCRPGGEVIVDGSRSAERDIIVRAMVSDPDGGRVLLQVEIKRIDEKFNGTRLLTSQAVSSGSAGWVRSPALEPGTSYHWRVRAIDPNEAAGAWVEFEEGEFEIADVTPG